MLRQWCVNENRSKVESMNAVAKMIRAHLEGIVAQTQTRQTNGLIKAINGHFQAANRKPAATAGSPPCEQSSS